MTTWEPITKENLRPGMRIRETQTVMGITYTREATLKARTNPGGWTVADGEGTFYLSPRTTTWELHHAVEDTP